MTSDIISDTENSNDIIYAWWHKNYKKKLKIWHEEMLKEDCKKKYKFCKENKLKYIDNKFELIIFSKKVIREK